jgi:hypothetical protein
MKRRMKRRTVSAKTELRTSAGSTKIQQSMTNTVCSVLQKQQQSDQRLESSFSLLQERLIAPANRPGSREHQASWGSLEKVPCYEGQAHLTMLVSGTVCHRLARHCTGAPCTHRQKWARAHGDPYLDGTTGPHTRIQSTCPVVQVGASSRSCRCQGVKLSSGIDVHKKVLKNTSV